MTPPRPMATTAAAALLLLSGCASLDPEAGLAAVSRQAAPHLPPGQQVLWSRSEDDQRRIEARVAELLARPLAADDAVQLALLNNRHLQAALAELGVADAERVQAARLPNPGFSFGRLTRGGEVEIERGLDIGLSRLLAMPLLQRQAAQRSDALQSELALQVVTLAGQTRKAWVRAVAAGESLRYSRQVMQAAEAGAELARRMAQVGNFSRLQQAREQAFYADAALALARAQAQQQAERERLTRLLGLWGEQAAAFQLPERLPELPAQAREWPEVERDALAQRLDVAAARAAAARTATQAGLERRTRFIDVLELGLEHNSAHGEPPQRGFSLRLELPLFDWGDARVARAEQLYRQALHRTAAVAVQARSEAREAYGAYRSAWDIARHQRHEIVPLRARIAEENMLRYNGMLIGVFELLADARAQIASVDGAIAALRDHWLAAADLDLVLVGSPAGNSPAGTPTAPTTASAAGSGGAGH